MKRALFLSLVCAVGMAAGASTSAAVASPEAALFSTGLPGRPISAVEAQDIAGGDVFMFLNALRTKMTVKVYSNDDELRRLRPTPLNTYEVDVHNRIQDTTTAPYMPAPGYPKAAGSELTTRPSPFPAGTSRVVDVVKTANKYGPFMIKTDAVGSVEVYSKGKPIGNYNDVGYAVHANKDGFDGTRTNGCIQTRNIDNYRIGRELLNDRADAAQQRQSGRPVQLLHLPERD